MQFTQEELAAKLEAHSLADLHDANLVDVDLDCADLSSADLSGANLERAYLGHANLSKADLSGANLKDAYLVGTNLKYAHLQGANLNVRAASPAVCDALATSFTAQMEYMKTYVERENGKNARKGGAR